MRENDSHAGRLDLPRCLDRQFLMLRMVCASMCIFSKLTSLPSENVLLPSCVKVMSIAEGKGNKVTNDTHTNTKKHFIAVRREI